MGGIQPLWEQMPLTKTEMQTAPEPRAARDAGFGDIFRTAIDAVRETDTERNQAEYLMATGQLDNPSVLLIAETKAGYAVDLMVQLRNKAVDAYNELMRISM